MGMGAQNSEARLAASIGQLDEPVAPDFQAVQDVPKGGVLFALPALLVIGLLKTSENFFKLRKGYYGLDRIPEVRTLRRKIKQLTQDDGSRQWSEALCKEWMQSAP